MNKIFTHTLLAAVLSAVPAALTAQDTTPSVVDRTQTTKLKEEKKAADTQKKYSDPAEFRKQINLAVESKKVRYLVYKDAEVVEELLKLFNAVDPESKAALSMQNDVLNRALGHATKLADRTKFDQLVALAKSLPNAEKNGCFTYSVGGLIGTYNSAQQLVYAKELFEMNRNVLPPIHQLNVLPAFVKQILRYTGDEKMAEDYTAKILAVQNPVVIDEKNPRSAASHADFEKRRIGALNSAVCRALEYKTAFGEKLLEKYKDHFTDVEMGNIYVSFCKAAVAVADRALFDKILAKIKALPASDARCDRLREAANAAAGRGGGHTFGGSEPLRLKILDDLLKEDLSSDQRYRTLMVRTSFPGAFNYGFHNPGSYERAKAIVQQTIKLADEHNLPQNYNYLVNAMKCAYDFGDSVFFDELLKKLVSIDKANADRQADNRLHRAEDLLLNRPKNAIAIRKKREADVLKANTDQIQKRRNADLARKDQEIANAKKQNKPDLVKKAEEEKTAINAKADAALKALNDKFSVQNAANEKKDKETLAVNQAKYDKEVELSRKERLCYAARWEHIVLSLLLENKKQEAVVVLNDVMNSTLSANTKPLVPYIKYFLEGGTFDGFDKAFADAKLTSEQKMHKIRQVGAFYFRAKMFEEARKLNDEIVAKMFRPAEINKRYTVKYMKNAPQTADAWSRTPDYKNWNVMETRFAPYFGYDMHNDTLLLKDTELPKLDDKYKSGLHIVFDEAAVHVYLRSDDPDVEKVRQGFANGPTLEWLFRPGTDCAYYSVYFENMPNLYDSADVNWAGATKHYRLVYDGIKKDAVITPEGFAAHVTIPWIFVYDKLPSKDNQWSLGLCIWGKGTRTVGGTVHELARALKLDFEMTPAQRTALERTIAQQAFARYDKIRKDAGGIIQNWNDSVLGDPAFYKASLESYIAELDEAGKKLLAPAPDADIHEIFTKYVPQWAEINYILDEKRSEYLSDQLFK